MPVAVAPPRFQRAEQRRGAADHRQMVPGEVGAPVAAGQVAGEPGALAGDRRHRGQRVRGGDDVAGAGQHRGRPGWPAESGRRLVQPGERGARCPGMAGADERGPRRRIPVEVDAGRHRVHLVHEVAFSHHGSAGGRAADRRHRQAADTQMPGERVLGGELGGGADAHVMALNEDGAGAVADQARGRHRPRAAPGDDGSGARRGGVPRAAGGQALPGGHVISGEHRVHLVAGERGPVGLDQLLAHAVNKPGRDSQPGHGDSPRSAAVTVMPRPGPGRRGAAGTCPS